MTAPTKSTFRESRPGILGSKRANLVTQRDSGWEGVQFRVQCEVWIHPSEAAIVDKVCEAGKTVTEDELKAAEAIVLKYADREASGEFLQVLKLAFLDQRNPPPSPGGREQRK